MKILIVGFGHVGAELLNLALKSPLTNGHQYFVGTRNPGKHKERFNLVNLSSMAAMSDLREPPSATLFKLDLDEREESILSLHRLMPDIVINTASRQAWWFPTLLPRHAAELLASNPVGPSLPNHLVPAMQLQQALRLSGARERAFTINAAYPDAVNPVLAKIGLSYEIGAGNIANPMNAIRAAAALESGRATRDIVIRAYGHHSFSYRVTRQGNPAPAPFHIEFEDTEGSNLKLDPLAVFRHLPTTLKRTSGLPGTLMTAASLWTTLRAVLEDHRMPFFAPGPNGLEGGYTVRLVNRLVEVVAPRHTTFDHVAWINRQGAILDGIDDIADDGTVVFAPGPMAVVAQALGYECERMSPLEAAARSDEWMLRFRQCCQRHQTAQVA